MKNVLKNSLLWSLFLGVPTFSVCAEEFYDTESEETLYEVEQNESFEDNSSGERNGASYTKDDRIRKQKMIVDNAETGSYLPSVWALKHLTEQRLIVTLKSLRDVERDNKSTLLHLDMYEGSNFATLISNALDYLLDERKQKDDSSLKSLFLDIRSWKLTEPIEKLREAFRNLSKFDVISFEEGSEYSKTHETALKAIKNVLTAIEEVDLNRYLREKYSYFIEFLGLAQKITSLVSVRYHTNEFMAAHRSELERMQNDSSVGADIDLGSAELSWNTVADDVDSASFHTTTTTLGVMGKVSNGIFSAKLGYKHAKIAMFYSLEAYMDYLNSQGLMAQKSLDYYMRRADSDFKKALEDRKGLQEKEKEALANCGTFEKYLKMFRVLPQTGVSLNWITVTEGTSKAEASEHTGLGEAGVGFEIIEGISGNVTANVSHSWKKYIKETPLLAFIDEDCRTISGLSGDNLKDIIGSKYDLRSRDTRLSVDDLLDLVGGKSVSINDLEDYVSEKYDLSMRIDNSEFSVKKLLEHVGKKFLIKGGVFVNSFLSLIGDKEKYNLEEGAWKEFSKKSASGIDTIDFDALLRDINANNNKEINSIDRIDDIDADALLKSINKKYDLKSKNTYVTVKDLLDLIYKNSDFRKRYTVDELLNLIGEKYDLISNESKSFSMADLKKSINKSYKLETKIDDPKFSADGFLDLLFRRCKLKNQKDESDLQTSVEQRRKTYTEQLRSIEANTFLGYLDEYVSVLTQYATDTSKSVQLHKQKCEKNLLPKGMKGREEVLKSMILTSALLREETPDDQENSLRFRKMYNLISKLAQLVRFSRSSDGVSGLVGTARSMFHADGKNKTTENLEVKSSKTVAGAKLDIFGTSASLAGKRVKGSPFLQENGKYVTLDITLPSAVLGTGLIKAVHAFEKRFTSLLENNSEEISKESNKKNDVSKSGNESKKSGPKTDEMGFFADAFSLMHAVPSEDLPVIGAGVSAVKSVESSVRSAESKIIDTAVSVGKNAAGLSAKTAETTAEEATKATGANPLVKGETEVKFNWKWVEDANGGQYSLPGQGKILDRKKIPLVLDFITIISRSRLNVTLLGGASVGKAIKVTGYNTLHDITSKFNALSMGKVDAESDVSTEFLFKEQVYSLQKLFRNIAKMNTNAAFELQVLYNDLINSYGEGGREKYDLLFENFIAACKNFSEDEELSKSEESSEERLLQKGGKFREALDLFREILNAQYSVIFKPYYDRAFSKAEENMIEKKSESRDRLKKTVSNVMSKKFESRERFNKVVDDLRDKSKN